MYPALLHVLGLCHNNPMRQVLVILPRYKHGAKAQRHQVTGPKWQSEESDPGSLAAGAKNLGSCS